jgi:hypothetical protein
VPQFGAVATFIANIDGIMPIALEWTQVTQIDPWTPASLLELDIITPLRNLDKSSGTAITTVIEIFGEFDPANPDLKE